MREKKYHIYLTDDEQSRVIQSLINLKNNLIVQAVSYTHLTLPTKLEV